jgi:hypothetical protein
VRKILGVEAYENILLFGVLCVFLLFFHMYLGRLPQSQIKYQVDPVHPSARQYIVYSMSLIPQPLISVGFSVRDHDHYSLLRGHFNDVRTDECEAPDTAPANQVLGRSVDDSDTLSDLWLLMTQVL